MNLLFVVALTLAQAEAAPAVPPESSSAKAAEPTLANPPPAAPSDEKKPQGSVAEDRSGKNPVSGLKLITDTPWWQRVKIGGFARVGVFYSFPFREEQLVGGNGGFRLADFRLNFDFRPVEKLTVYASVEFAAPLVDPLDPLNGRRIVDVRDAFVEYEICRGFLVKAGQFRPGYYAEMLLSDGSIPFVSRSVLASGIAPPEGFGPRQGLAPERQVGLQFSSKRLGDTFGIRYAVGVFNGNGQNVLFNDNNMVNPVGRVEVDWDQTITLGVNAAYNVLTTGVRPNRLSTNNFDYGADLEAHKWGFQVLGAFLGRSSTYSFQGLQPDSSMGALGQLRYFHENTGLEGAARLAWYEPSRVQPDDTVIEVAAMVGWRPFKLPFRVLAQYTHRSEERLISYPNDSVDLMLHAIW
ncbi:MAG: OprO/OprP family phosphate-selective porin [Myxococcaceae bacterium]|nr:OprO/OprP family phosphate-selective porin [Myxococcaceae bacterium]